MLAHTHLLHDGLCEIDDAVDEWLQQDSRSAGSPADDVPQEVGQGWQVVEALAQVGDPVVPALDCGVRGWGGV